MENRTAAIIATIAAVILCGCPGIAACFIGALIAAGVINNETLGTTGNGPYPLSYGISLLCLALIFILIPVLVGFFTLRKKPGTTPIVPPPSAPIPPAI